MIPKILQEFDRRSQEFINLLEQLKEEVLDVSKIEAVKKDIEDIRLTFLFSEVREKYPDAEFDKELLELVGTEEEISLEEEREVVREALKEKLNDLS